VEINLTEMQHKLGLKPFTLADSVLSLDHSPVPETSSQPVQLSAYLDDLSHSAEYETRSDP
jgi:hypothetical protein